MSEFIKKEENTEKVEETQEENTEMVEQIEIDTNDSILKLETQIIASIKTQSDDSLYHNDMQQDQQQQQEQEHQQKEHTLNDSWWLWMHGMRDNDWSAKSYKRLAKITTVEQFLGLNKPLSTYIADSMFFFMRHGPGDDDNPICPMWEDAACENGGAWKFKVLRASAAVAWKEIAIRLIGETITDNPSDILGMTISPKRCFVTVSIWNKDAKNNNRSQLKIPDHEYFHNAIYEAHKDRNRSNDS